MSVNFNNKFFIGNRKRVTSKLIASSVAFVNSSEKMPRNGDLFYPYRQNSDMFYLTGIEQEETLLMLCPTHSIKELREILFISKPDDIVQTWDGSMLTKDEASKISGIKNVQWNEDSANIIKQIILSIENIYINLPENKRQKFTFPLLDHRFKKKLKRKYPSHNYCRLAPVMTECRIIKSTDEINIVKHAAGITNKAFRSAVKYIKPGINERDIEAEITYEFLKNGVRSHSFHPIIASGENATTLHYNSNNSKCKDGDLVLMDFGAEYKNYAADMSRTVPVNGKFTKRQKELYNATVEVFRYAKELMKPGITINEIQEKVCKKWEAEHIKLGLYTKQQAAKEQLYKKYFMHGVSHFIGLDVHDLGEKDQKLKPGMIISCEPGIYIKEEGIGIRIENDILITKTGNIDLMSDLPIEISDIEAMMKK